MTGRRKGTPCACETDPCSCGSSKGKCIRTINNLSPDPNGDFFIEAGSGITITQTGDNSFEVSFDGTLPSNPLIYKGTVGSGGTVAVLPAADPDNIGWMYIAIEAATSPVTYEVGDTLISDGYTWQVIPSGDDPVDWSQILNTPTTLAGYGITDAMQANTTPGVWAYTHSGVYQGQTAVAGNAAANSLLSRDSDGCGQVADPAADTDSDYAVNVRTLNRRLTDGSVSKIGTSNVGNDTKPIKLVGGVPTVVTNDLVDLPSAQAITGAKTVPLEATGTFSGQIASSNKVKNELDNYAPMVRTVNNQTINGIKVYTKPVESSPGGWHHTFTVSSNIGEISLFAKLKDEAIGKYIDLEFIQSSNTATLYGMLGIANTTSATGFWYIRRATGSNNPLQADSIVIAKDGNGVQYLGCRRKVTYGAMRARVIKSYNYGVLYDTPSPLIEWLDTPILIGTGTGYTITEMTE